MKYRLIVPAAMAGAVYCLAVPENNDGKIDAQHSNHRQNRNFNIKHVARVAQVNVETIIATDNNFPLPETRTPLETIEVVTVTITPTEPISTVTATLAPTDPAIVPLSEVEQQQANVLKAVLGVLVIIPVLIGICIVVLWFQPPRPHERRLHDGGETGGVAPPEPNNSSCCYKPRKPAKKKNARPSPPQSDSNSRGQQTRRHQRIESEDVQSHEMATLWPTRRNHSDPVAGVDAPAPIATRTSDGSHREYFAPALRPNPAREHNMPTSVSTIVVPDEEDSALRMPPPHPGHVFDFKTVDGNKKMVVDDAMNNNNEANLPADESLYNEQGFYVSPRGPRTTSALPLAKKTHAIQEDVHVENNNKRHRGSVSNSTRSQQSRGPTPCPLPPANGEDSETVMGGRVSADGAFKARRPGSATGLETARPSELPRPVRHRMTLD